MWPVLQSLGVWDIVWNVLELGCQSVTNVTFRDDQQTLKTKDKFEFFSKFGFDVKKEQRTSSSNFDWTSTEIKHLTMTSQQRKDVGYLQDSALMFYCLYKLYLFCVELYKNSQEKLQIETTWILMIFLFTLFSFNVVTFILDGIYVSVKGTL